MKIEFKSYLLTTPHIKAMVKAMKEAGLRVVEDKDAATVEGFYGKTQIFWAIEKGVGQPWIVRHAVDLFV